MLILSPETIGRGWVEVRFAENPRDPLFGQIPLIRTLDQWYSPTELRWKTGSYFTRDRYAYRGNPRYRRPVSLGACLRAVFPGWFRKVWWKVTERFRRDSA